jgi:hypothetical protein
MGVSTSGEPRHLPLWHGRPLPCLILKSDPIVAVLRAESDSVLCLPACTCVAVTPRSRGRRKLLGGNPLFRAGFWMFVCKFENRTGVHTTESFVKSWQSLRLLRSIMLCIGPDRVMTYSQPSAIGSYLEAVQHSPDPHKLFFQNTF